MKKPAIPSSPPDQFSKSVKETLEIITGIRGEKLKPLAADASLDDVIAKVNEIISLLQ